MYNHWDPVRYKSLSLHFISGIYTGWYWNATVLTMLLCCVLHLVYGGRDPVVYNCFEQPDSAKNILYQVSLQLIGNNTIAECRDAVGIFSRYIKRLPHTSPVACTVYAGGYVCILITLKKRSSPLMRPY